MFGERKHESDISTGTISPGAAPASRSSLLVVLLAVNLMLNPARFHPADWGTLIGLAAPLIGAALASTPVILAGRGGIDISVGPLMGFVNAIVIKVLFTRSRHHFAARDRRRRRC